MNWLSINTNELLKVINFLILDKMFLSKRDNDTEFIVKNYLSKNVHACLFTNVLCFMYECMLSKHDQ